MRSDPNIDKISPDTRFKPGQSGNPNGRPRIKPMTDEIHAQLAANGGSQLKAIITKAVEAAANGDVRYFKELIERMDGRVIEQIELNADVNIQDLPGLTELDLAKLGDGHDGPD